MDTRQAGQSHHDPLESIDALIPRLSSRDVLERSEARHKLAHHGRAAVPALLDELNNPAHANHWEVAKTLSEICDPAAAPALVAAMNDARFDVRWVAAEGLIRLKMDGACAVLKGLIDHSESAAYRESVHHVLRAMLQRTNGRYLAPVIAALEGPEPAVAAIQPAHAAMLAISDAIKQHGGDMSQNW